MTQIIPQAPHRGNTQLTKIEYELDQERDRFHNAASDDQFIAAWDRVLLLYAEYFKKRREGDDVGF